MDHIDTLISRVSCPCVKNSENQANQFFVHGVYPMLCSEFGFWVKMLKFRQLTPDMRVFIWSMGSPDCKDSKLLSRKSIFAVPDLTPLFGGLGGMNDPLKD